MAKFCRKQDPFETSALFPKADIQVGGLFQRKIRPVSSAPFADGQPLHKAIGFYSGLEEMLRRVPNLWNASGTDPNANSPVP